MAKFITQDTSNGDVRKILYNLIRESDEGIDEQTAWDIVQKVKGKGIAFLRFSRERWVEVLGHEWGQLIYEEVESHKPTLFGHGLRSFNHYFSSWLHVRPCSILPNTTSSNTLKASPSRYSSTQVSPKSSTLSHVPDGLNKADYQHSSKTVRPNQSRKRLPYHHDTGYCTSEGETSATQ